MNIKILCKKTGLGNQIWFIPALTELLSQGHYVYSDSDVYEQLDLDVPKDDKTRPNRCYLLYYYNRKKVLQERLKYPFTPLYGFKWILGKRLYGFMLQKAVPFPWPDHTVHEIELNKRLVPNNRPFYLRRAADPVDKRVALLTSEKRTKFYKYWATIENDLTGLGFDVRVYGDLGITFNTIKEFYVALSSCESYIGVDCGGQKLADIMGIPGLVIWGKTEDLRAYPINGEILHFSKLEPSWVLSKFMQIPK